MSTPADSSSTAARGSKRAKKSKQDAAAAEPYVPGLTAEDAAAQGMDGVDQATKPKKAGRKKEQQEVVPDVVTDDNLAHLLVEMRIARSNRDYAAKEVAPSVYREKCIIAGLKKAFQENPDMAVPPVQTDDGKTWSLKVTHAAKKPPLGAVLPDAIMGFHARQGRMPAMSNADDKKAVTEIAKELCAQRADPNVRVFSFKWTDVAAENERRIGAVAKVMDKQGFDVQAPAVRGALESLRHIDLKPLPTQPAPAAAAPARSLLAYE